MNATKFTQDAIKTESVIDQVKIHHGVFDGMMKAMIALGENADMLKKNVYYGKPIADATWWRNVNIVIEQMTSMKDYSNHVYNHTQPIANLNPRLFHAAIGMYTESIEMFEALFAAAATGEPVDVVNFAEEVADSLWYASIACDETGIGMDTMMETIIAKLRKRYPNKFESHRAIDRDTDSERVILDSGFGGTINHSD
jgi:hypothetical protein